MKLLPITAVALFLLVQSSLSSMPQQTETGGIAGVVVRIGTTEPLAGVRVYAFLDGILRDPSRVPSATTDASGAFTMSGLAPGQYGLRFQLEGYVEELYGGHRVPDQNATAVIVKAGKIERSVVMPLTPAATIGGRVVDSQGLPIAGISVLMFVKSYSKGGSVLFDSAGGAKTDDRGRYRLRGIEPGNVFLMVNGVMDGGRAASGPGEKYEAVLYPGVREFNAAQSIHVTQGMDLQLADFTLDRIQLYHVRGRVVEDQTGQAPAGATVSSERQNIPPVSPDSFLRYSTTIPSDPKTGAFEIPALPPGEYAIRAAVIGAACPPIGRNDGPLQYRARGVATVKVSTADVDGVVIVVHNNGCLGGSIAMEGGQALWEWAGFDLISVDDRSAAYSVISNSSGAFWTDEVPTGSYFVNFKNLPDGIIMGSAKFGDVDVSTHALTLKAANTTSLQIVMSRHTANVSGIALGDTGKPAAYAVVVFVPNRLREIPMRYGVAAADADGRFTFNGAPGDYTVLAFESIQPYSWLDPTVLAKYDGKGIAVQLQESANGALSLRTIPGDAPR